MSERKQDRRVKYTKMVIKDSFVQLLKEKPLSKISVKEICERADLNRATFYAHYTDPYDLMDQISAELVSDINRCLCQDEGVEPWNLEEALTRIFSYIRENASICQALLGDHDNLSFRTLLMALVRQQYLQQQPGRGDLPAEDAEYVFTFLLLGCVGVIQKWLDSGMEKREPEMAHLIIRLAEQGSSAYLHSDA